jgi:transcription elongation factor Elf1
MDPIYGYNCICGKEYDIDPNCARSNPSFKCKNCGRMITTGFNSLLEKTDHYKNIKKKLESRGPRPEDFYDDNVKPDNDWLKEPVLNVLLFKKWIKSNKIPNRVKCMVLLRESSKGNFELIHFQQPEEGRHMIRIRYKTFENLEEAKKIFEIWIA